MGGEKNQDKDKDTLVSLNSEAYSGVFK